MKLYPLSVALSASAVLVSLSEGKTPYSFDAFSSAVSGVEYDPVEMDSAEGCEANQALLSFVSFLGVSDSVIEDMVSSREDVSMDAITSLAHAFTSKYSEDDTYSLAEEFSEQYDDSEVSMDGISPKRCQSGYKRKMVIRDNKPKWICQRMFGKKILSAKQKQALRKARTKSHTALAKYSRNRSMKTGSKKGLHK